MAKAHELYSNNQKVLFAQKFSNEKIRAMETNYPGNNLSFSQRNNVPTTVPMDIDSSISRLRKNFKNRPLQNGSYIMALNKTMGYNSKVSGYKAAKRKQQ